MNQKALLTKGFLALTAEFAVFAALVFGSAGTVLWPAGWVFLAIFFGVGLAIVLWLTREDPELLVERLSSPIQRGQPLWDKVFLATIMPLFVVWLILIPLGAVRFGWSEVPDWLQILGALGLVLSFYIVFLTFRENAYLAPVVKLQEERAHSVVRTGPYRYVRHPMYSSMFMFFPATALLLGSWWGLLFCPVLLGLLVWRTTLEDRMLCDYRRAGVPLAFSGLYFMLRGRPPSRGNCSQSTPAAPRAALAGAGRDRAALPRTDCSAGRDPPSGRRVLVRRFRTRRRGDPRSLRPRIQSVPSPRATMPPTARPAASPPAAGRRSAAV